MFDTNEMAIKQKFGNIVLMVKVDKKNYSIANRNWNVLMAIK